MEGGFFRTQAYKVVTEQLQSINTSKRHDLSSVASALM